MEKRTLAEEKGFITKVGECAYVVKKGFVPNMNVDGKFYVNDKLKDLLFEELEDFSSHGGHGGFIPAVKQIANVASLPGIVGYSLGMPDIHSGYAPSLRRSVVFNGIIQLRFLYRQRRRLRHEQPSGYCVAWWRRF